MTIPTDFPCTETAPGPIAPDTRMLGVSTATLRAALIHVCRRGLVYEDTETNAWLLPGALLVPQQELIEGVRAYFENTLGNISGIAFSGKHIMERLTQEQLTSARCAAVLHRRGKQFHFSAVVRVDPAVVWQENEARPTIWLTHPVDVVDLLVIENLANASARGRRGSRPHLEVLLRAPSKPLSPAHPAPTLPAPHAVLATYPELAVPGLLPTTRSSDE